MSHCDATQVGLFVSCGCGLYHGESSQMFVSSNYSTNYLKQTFVQLRSWNCSSNCSKQTFAQLRDEEHSSNCSRRNFAECSQKFAVRIISWYFIFNFNNPQEWQNTPETCDVSILLNFPNYYQRMTISRSLLIHYFSNFYV